MNKSPSKMRRNTPWEELSSEEAGDMVRMEARYNRSSLAVEPDPYPYDYRGAPHLVQVPVAAQRIAPTFASLDTALAQRNPKTRVVSVIIHAGAACLVVWLGMHTGTIPVPANMAVNHIDFKLFAPPPPPKILPVASVSGGGGGGGDHKIIEPTKGRPPEVAKIQVNAPQI